MNITAILGWLAALSWVIAAVRVWVTMGHLGYVLFCVGIAVVLAVAGTLMRTDKAQAGR